MNPGVKGESLSEVLPFVRSSKVAPPMLESGFFFFHLTCEKHMSNEDKYLKLLRKVAALFETEPTDACEYKDAAGKILDVWMEAKQAVMLHDAQ